MAKYDVEHLLSDLASIVTNNLNTKIGAINTEKNDSIVLDTWDTTQIFFQDLDKSSAAASKLFLFYGIDDPIVDGIGPASAQTFEVFFILVVQDTGENAGYMTRLLRYMRAMQEIFQDNYTTILRIGRIRMSSLSPVSWNTEGSGTFRATGVKLKVTLA